MNSWNAIFLWVLLGVTSGQHHTVVMKLLQNPPKPNKLYLIQNTQRRENTYTGINWTDATPPFEMYYQRSQFEVLNFLMANKYPVVLIGEKGMGKSELANYYANYFQHRTHGSVFWIDCTKPIMAQIYEIAHNLLIVQTDPSLLYKVFTAENPALFIFDNATPGDQIIFKLFNIIGTDEPIYFVITSRHINWQSCPDMRLNKIVMEKFTKNEAYAFLKAAFTYHELTINKIEALADSTRYYPALLAGAVKYIAYQCSPDLKIDIVLNFMASIKQNESWLRI